MSDLLLDDGEMARIRDKIYDEYQGTPSFMALVEAGAKAQDAKTKKGRDREWVKWLDKHNVAPEHPLRHLEISYLNWQALKKEVEDG